jgi:hypothetical protein
MAETKRSEFQAERDRVEIARLYLRGDIQQDITDEINRKYYPDNPLSRQQISYDIRLMIDRWVKASNNHVDQKKAVELAKIDRLENEYWDAWERSRENAEIEVTEQIGSRAKPDKDKPGEIVITPERIKKYKRVEGQSGNPAFLAGVMSCINKRCELLGLDAPKKIAPTNPDGDGPAILHVVYDNKVQDQGRDV